MRCRAYAEVVTQLPVTCGEESKILPTVKIFKII